LRQDYGAKIALFFANVDKKPIFAVCRAVTWWQPKKTNKKGCRGTTALQADNKNNQYEKDHINYACPAIGRGRHGSRKESQERKDL
jgi:hypothetical protein